MLSFNLWPRGGAGILHQHPCTLDLHVLAVPGGGPNEFRRVIPLTRCDTTCATRAVFTVPPGRGGAEQFCGMLKFICFATRGSHACRVSRWLPGSPRTPVDTCVIYFFLLNPFPDSLWDVWLHVFQILKDVQQSKHFKKELDSMT